MATSQTISILGVRVTDSTRAHAIRLLQDLIHRGDDRPHSVYFVNAHTLNLASADPSYRTLLNAADYVFGDGTGVRWAARLQGVRLRDNLAGTDLVPEFLVATSGRGHRYFLLGSDGDTIRAAAKFAHDTFAGCTLAGYHHGYLSEGKLADQVIRRINRSRADVLLVGMGNPLQERWIHEHRDELRVRVCLGVGGLFDFWAGKTSRAPRWLRQMGHEWLWRLGQQPADKARRYLVGNPLFLGRIVRDWCGLGGCAD